MGGFFVGREEELRSLEDIYSKKISSLVIIKGRRRIGKSSLVINFAKDKLLYNFSGLPPSGLTAQDQRNEFAKQISQHTSLPQINTDDWSDLFKLLYECVRDKKIVLFFDEVSWLASNDKTFLPKLKNAWDLYFKNNPNLMLILCGSVSTWIEKNIISSTGFYGRITQIFTLSALPLSQCNLLLKKLGFKKSALEKFWILSLTGGIPWYIELVNANYNAIDNIKQLCFEKSGALVCEHKYMFDDLFGNRSAIYEKITEFLASGAASYKEISENIGYVSSGKLSEYIDNLIESGYISYYPSWNFRSGQIKKIGNYRLSDNYLRFYYKYIKPKLFAIENGQIAHENASNLPGLNNVMGLQFETLILNNRELIYKSLNLNPADIIINNPYYQRQTKANIGCQIDYLIQTCLNTAYICEIKFSKGTIGIEVIKEMQSKIKALATPREITCIPVLIHVGRVSSDLEDSGYFYKIINFNDFLND